MSSFYEYKNHKSSQILALQNKNQSVMLAIKNSRGSRTTLRYVFSALLRLPEPGKILMTPFGMPAFTASSANLSAVRGVTCEKTTSRWSFFPWLMPQLLFPVENVWVCWAHLRRFEDKRVPSRQAGGALPRQHHQRIVPGDDDGAHAARETNTGVVLGKFFVVVVVVVFVPKWNLFQEKTRWRMLFK